jgi:tetratricopeptide (TPR) repeat protein
LADPWGLLVRRGYQALLEGRFSECEHLAAQATVLAPGELDPGLLGLALLREQGRPAEAELLARDLLSVHPDAVEVHALLGAVLADVGRDSEAGRQLDRLDDEDCPPAVTALAAEIAAVVYRPVQAEALYRRLSPWAAEFVPTTGAIARHLGLLCHVLDRWDEAEDRFEAALTANGAAGAPVLVAHTRRQYSALLRVRGRAGDWERAIELLTAAAAVYRRLEIDRLTEEAEAVLRRSQDLGSEDDAARSPAGAGIGNPPGPPANVLRRTPEGWELAYGGHRGVVADSAGVGHVATLLSATGRPFHVIDLVGGPRGLGDGDVLRHQMLAEYRARLAELDDQPGSTPRDPLAGALARAERDFLRSELEIVTAGAPAAGEVGERARRLVALRIRTALDRIEEASPALARHLRRSIRTGTFCLYEPERPTRWRIER